MILYAVSDKHLSKQTKSSLTQKYLHDFLGWPSKVAFFHIHLLSQLDQVVGLTNISTALFGHDKQQCYKTNFGARCHK